jgi:hypothetical protein
MAVRLSALRTGRNLLPRNIIILMSLVLISVRCCRKNSINYIQLLRLNRHSSFAFISSGFYVYVCLSSPTPKTDGRHSTWTFSFKLKIYCLAKRNSCQLPCSMFDLNCKLKGRCSVTLRSTVLQRHSEANTLPTKNIINGRLIRCLRKNARRWDEKKNFRDKLEQSGYLGILGEWVIVNCGGKKKKILWHVNTLLGNDREITKSRTTFAK